MRNSRFQEAISMIKKSDAALQRIIETYAAVRINSISKVKYVDTKSEFLPGKCHWIVHIDPFEATDIDNGSDTETEDDTEMTPTNSTKTINKTKEKKKRGEQPLHPQMGGIDQRKGFKTQKDESAN